MYCVTIAFNVWAAINGLFASGVWFQISVLEYVNLVPHELWGLAYLGVGITLFLGLFRPNFALSHIGLAAGLFMAASRFLLLMLAVWMEQDVGGANTLTNMMMVVGAYVAQLLEPPVNPSTIIV
jgi:hypothetical protein